MCILNSSSTYTRSADADFIIYLSLHNSCVDHRPQQAQRHVIEVVMHQSVEDPRSVLAYAGKLQKASESCESQIGIPERIRINSTLLLDTIEEIAGERFHYGPYFGVDHKFKSQVMLRPF